MQQKQLLITSMQKLINHINTSSQNQTKIFKELTQYDFIKIINNFHDSSVSTSQSYVELRKISLLLIAHLLYDNPQHKSTFCQAMNITQHNGRVNCYNIQIVLTDLRQPQQINLSSFENNKILKGYLQLLKTPLSISESNCLFWFAAQDHQHTMRIFTIQRQKDKPISLSLTIDPMQYTAGIVIINKPISKIIKQPQKQSIATIPTIIQRSNDNSRRQSINSIKMKLPDQIKYQLKVPIKQPQQSITARNLSYLQSTQSTKQSIMDDRSPDSSLKPISKYDIRQYHNYSSINSSSKPNKDTSIDCSQRKRTGIKLISTLSNPRSIQQMNSVHDNSFVRMEISLGKSIQLGANRQSITWGKRNRV